MNYHKLLLMVLLTSFITTAAMHITWPSLSNQECGIITTKPFTSDLDQRTILVLENEYDHAYRLRHIKVYDDGITIYGERELFQTAMLRKIQHVKVTVNKHNAHIKRSVEHRTTLALTSTGKLLLASAVCGSSLIAHQLLCKK